MKSEALLKVAPFSGSRVQNFEGVKRYLSTGDLQSSSISFVDVTYQNRPSRADIVVKQGDVLFARMKGTKKVLEINDELSGTLVSTGFAVLRPTEECDIKFLSIYLKSDIFERQKEKFCSGAIQPAITNGSLKRVKIPLPPLNDQKRIAHLLGKVEGLIAQRKENLQQLDELLKIVFLDIFGDPVRNEKEWDKKPFEKLLSNIDSGWSPKCEARKANQDEWGVLKLGAVTSCNYLESENKALPDVPDSKKHHEIKAGDLLFSRKNTYALVAACTYVFETHPKLLMPDLIFRFVLKDKNEVNPLYLWKLLISDSQRKKIQSLAAGAAGSMPNISKTNLKQVLLPIPPIDLQNKFAAIIEKVEGIKGRYQQSLTKLENLYGTLSQKAFKGELDLSLVPLEHEIPTIAVTSEVLQADQSGFMEAFDKLDEYPMDTSEGRKEMLKKFFDEYIASLKMGGGFSVNIFWESAQFRSQDYMGEEPQQFGVSEYDCLKDWVFGLLGSGQLEQSFDEADNQIVLKAKS